MRYEILLANLRFGFSNQHSEKYIEWKKSKLPHNYPARARLSTNLLYCYMFRFFINFNFHSLLSFDQQCIFHLYKFIRFPFVLDLRYVKTTMNHDIRFIVSKLQSIHIRHSNVQDVTVISFPFSNYISKLRTTV